MRWLVADRYNGWSCTATVRFRVTLSSTDLIDDVA